MKLKTRFIAIVAFFSALVPGSGFAYDGEVEGKLKFVHLKPNNGDQALLLELTSGESLCGATYVSAQTYLAYNSIVFRDTINVATAALLADRAVRLWSDWDATTGLCRLKQIRLI